MLVLRFIERAPERNADEILSECSIEATPGDASKVRQRIATGDRASPASRVQPPPPGAKSSRAMLASATRCCTAGTPVCPIVLLAIVVLVAPSASVPPAPASASGAHLPHVFTNSFLVKLRTAADRAVVDHIARRNGFENWGPVSIGQWDRSGASFERGDAAAQFMRAASIRRARRHLSFLAAPNPRRRRRAANHPAPLRDANAPRRRRVRQPIDNSFPIGRGQQDRSPFALADCVSALLFIRAPLRRGRAIRALYSLITHIEREWSSWAASKVTPAVGVSGR